jgi:hypothetical protein
MKILNLTLYKKWFYLICSGHKKIEYREIKPYWIKRLIGRKYDFVLFRNGYARNSPKVLVKYIGLIYTQFEGKKVFGLILGDIQK